MATMKLSKELSTTLKKQAKEAEMKRLIAENINYFGLAAFAENLYEAMAKTVYSDSAEKIRCFIADHD